VSTGDPFGCEKEHKTIPKHHPKTTCKESLQVHSPRLSSQVKHALIVEESSAISTLLQGFGWTVTKHAPQNINTAITANLALDIKQHKYLLVWFDLPLSGRHIRKEKHFSAIRQVCTWARLAAEAGAMVGLYGAYGPLWNQDFSSMPFWNQVGSDHGQT